MTTNEERQAAFVAMAENFNAAVTEAAEKFKAFTEALNNDEDDDVEDA